jgi:hypothetical protein
MSCSNCFGTEEISQYTRIPISEFIAPDLFEENTTGEKLLTYKFRNEISNIIHTIYKQLPKNLKKDHKYYTFFCYSDVYDQYQRKLFPGITAFRKLWIRSRATEGFPAYIYDFNIQGVWDEEGPGLEIMIINGGPKWSLNLNERNEPEWNPPRFIIEIIKAFKIKLEEYLAPTREHVKAMAEVRTKLPLPLEVFNTEVRSYLPRDPKSIALNKYLAVNPRKTRRNAKRRKTRKN